MPTVLGAALATARLANGSVVRNPLAVPRQALPLQGDYVWEGPLTITRGGTYSGAWASNDSGTPAVLINTAEPVTLADFAVRGAGNLIKSGVAGVDVTITDGVGWALGETFSGISTWFLVLDHGSGFARAVVEDCLGIDTMGVRLSNSVGSYVRLRRNTMHNLGRIGGAAGVHHGNLVQFNVATDIDAIIEWNEAINLPFLSAPTDVISMFNASGTADTPIRIRNNLVRGLYSTDPVNVAGSFAGLQLGDGPSASVRGSYQHATNNLLLQTNSKGMSIAGGHHQVLDGNIVMNTGTLPDGRAVATNVGCSFGNADDLTWADNEIKNSVVAFINDASIGNRNDYWEGSPELAVYENNESLLRVNDQIIDIYHHDWLIEAVAAGFTPYALPS